MANKDQMKPVPRMTGSLDPGFMGSNHNSKSNIGLQGSQLSTNNLKNN
jgi:hypothetical protein